MSRAPSYSQQVAKVRKLWNGGKYDQALSAVEEMMTAWPGNAALHVAWACLVQLQEETSHELSAVKRALETARELDDKSSAASIELGNFLDAVEDDAEGAEEAFGGAASIARKQLIEALSGRARALLQLDRSEEATRCLIEVLQLSRGVPKAKTGKSTNGNADLAWSDASGGTLHVQVKGGLTEEIQSLVQDVLAATH